LLVWNDVIMSKVGVLLHLILNTFVLSDVVLI